MGQVEAESRASEFFNQRRLPIFCIFKSESTGPNIKIATEYVSEDAARIDKVTSVVLEMKSVGPVLLILVSA